MLPMLATTALAGGLSALSGFGQKQSVASQNKRQMAHDRLIAEANLAQSDEDNEIRERLGRELLTIPEVTTEVVQDNRWQRRTTSGGSRSDSGGDIDIARFMAAGEAAGFNPVTWLNSGAISAYARSWTDASNWSDDFLQHGGEATTTTTKTGHNAADAFKLMNPETFQMGTTQIQREPSSMEILGNAGTAALSMYNNLNNQQASRDFQTSQLDRQLAAMAQRGGGGGVIANGVPGTSVTYGPSANSGGNASKNAGLTGLPNPAGWEAGKTEVTNPWVAWRVDPRSADAQNVEDRYAEVVSNIYGVYSVANDAVLNTSGTTIPNGLTNWWNGRPWGGGPIMSGPGVGLRNYAQWGVHDRGGGAPVAISGGAGWPGGSASP